MLKVPAIICNDCDYLVFSRANHDMRYCECGTQAIDGGFAGYCSLTGPPENRTSVGVKIDATVEDLHDDWNFRKDIWGLHKLEEVREGQRVELIEVEVKDDAADATG